MYNSLLFAVSLFLPIPHMHAHTYTPFVFLILSLFTLLSHSKLSFHPTFFARKVSINSFIVYYLLCLLNSFFFFYFFFFFLIFFFFFFFFLFFFFWFVGDLHCQQQESSWDIFRYLNNTRR